MAETTAPLNDEEYINKMYDSALAGKKQSLTQNYEQDTANLEAEQQKQQKQTDANLNRTYVEAAKAQKNYNEVQNAYGLTSGAMAQARLAQDNQLQQDLTTIRAAQQTVDADVERQRTLLSKEYAAAIAQAQADNDLQRAQALYETAKEDEALLRQEQQDAADLARKREEQAAALMAGVGDYSLYAQLYGLTPEQLAKLQGETAGSGGGSSGESTGYYGTPTPTPTPKPIDKTGTGGGTGTQNQAGGNGITSTFHPLNTGLTGSHDYNFIPSTGNSGILSAGGIAAKQPTGSVVTTQPVSTKKTGGNSLVLKNLQKY